MSIAWTPIRLTMSTSSQTSSLSEHVNAIRTNKSTHTGAYHHNNNYYGDNYLRRQATVLEKQTVRITPPSCTDGPKSTVIIEKRKANGYGNVISSGDPTRCSRTSSSEIKNCLHAACVTDGHYFLEHPAEASSRLFVDKQCQTDEFLLCRKTTSIKSTNMDDSGECSSPACDNFTSEGHYQSLQNDVVDNPIYTSSNDYYHNSVRAAERIESKDREIEHIDVIVNESRYTPATTDEVILELDPAVVDEIIVDKKDENEPEIETEDAKPNGFLAEPEIEIQKAENSKLKDDKKLTEDDDDDSCLVNCLYISLNVCECVIL